MKNTTSKMQFLQDILALFYPKLCVSCNKYLLTRELLLCTNCRHDLSIIDIQNYYKNKITSTFYGRVPIKKGLALLYFSKKGKVRKLIHNLKYKNQQEIGMIFGSWLGKMMHESNQFNDIDCVVPVPLHKKRLRERGYNQVTAFGKHISKELKIAYKPGNLLRVSSAKTQTLKQRLERFDNANSKFIIVDALAFENKHVLLVDDVVTTGATLEACCKELLKTKNITISIATIAYTQRI